MDDKQFDVPDQFNYSDEDPAGGSGPSIYIPPDEPMGSHSVGVTAAEQEAGETLRERSRHTNPEVDELGSENETISQILRPGDEEADLTSDEAAAIAVSEELDLDAGYSAEEAAMHSVEDE